MEYLDAYNLARASEPDGSPFTDAEIADPAVDLTRVRRLCEMVLVRQHCDWYAGNPATNISKAIHRHCQGSGRRANQPRSRLRRHAAVLAWAYARLDHDSDDAFLLLEQVSKDLAGDDGRILSFAHRAAIDERLERWRADRGIPRDLSVLSAHETSIWHEVLRWEVQPQSLWTPFAEALETLKGHMAALAPESLKGILSDALSGGLSKLHDAAASATRDAALLADVRAAGHEVLSVTDLRSVPIALLDRIAESTVASGKIAAALEGAGTGFGGPLLMAADLPLLMAVNLRSISQVAHTYGFPTESPEEKMFVMNLIGAASSERATRSGFVSGMNRIALDVARGATWRDVEGKAYLALLAKLAEVLGFSLTKRKLGQVIPVAGAAVGAGANYAYTSDNLVAARMMYRKRWLIHRCEAR